MGIIRDLIPLNEQAEKEQFFADQNYNPQFEYVREFTDHEMTKYGQPNEVYFNHAKQMLDTYGPPQNTVSETLHPPQIADFVFNLLNTLNLPKIPVHFESQLNTRAMMSDDGLHFRLPIRFNRERLASQLNHELQSHYLRRYNQSLQDWNFESERLHPRAFRMTEEGLANIHSYIERPDPIMRKTYLNYYASYLGQRVSFAELFSALKAYGITDKLAWVIAIKQKRGLKDTSKPGGFPKNHVYLEGLVEVLRWILAGNDPKKLYWGRISLGDTTKLAKVTCHPRVVYPVFMKDIDAYREKLVVIARKNQLEKLV